MAAAPLHRDVISAQELGRLLGVSGHRQRLAWLLGLDAGLRISEIVSVGPDNVSGRPDAPMLCLRGKGGLLRRIPLGERLLEAIEHEEVRRAALATPRERPYIRVGVRQLQRLFKAACRRADILVPGRTPHSLRHTYAVRLLAQGVPVTTVQRVLGHQDLATTAIYLHLLPGWEAPVREALDRLAVLEEPRQSGLFG
jgi:integrase/recombinase XerD